ncbi:MAG: hypothetical protein SCABRO_01774 [Candidatus Scalindua brodae]|uniref:Uncharacterized protein n=1 Tax=Candidatus Scalindua brodae TaxID=237368 RepID=A0A0B0EIS3_9BACT|nr:MAG: hypothetical protein SCABRO_01774 [Candidatus Scalindua brodae]
MFSIEGLSGIVTLKTGENVSFERVNEYIPVRSGQKASFRIVKLTKDGKILHLAFKKGK